MQQVPLITNNDIKRLYEITCVTAKCSNQTPYYLICLHRLKFPFKINSMEIKY
jgi:hypothetical protein